MNTPWRERTRVGEFEEPEVSHDPTELSTLGVQHARLSPLLPVQSKLVGRVVPSEEGMRGTCHTGTLNELAPAEEGVSEGLITELYFYDTMTGPFSLFRVSFERDRFHSERLVIHFLDNGREEKSIRSEGLGGIVLFRCPN